MYITVNSIHMMQAGIAEVCPRAERYVGTQRGGMDQAIALLADVGQVLLLFPLSPIKDFKYSPILQIACCFQLMHMHLLFDCLFPQE